MITYNSRKDTIISHMSLMICEMLDYFNRLDIAVEAAKDEKHRGPNALKPKVTPEKLEKIAEIHYEECKIRLDQLTKDLENYRVRGKKAYLSER